VTRLRVRRSRDHDAGATGTAGTAADRGGRGRRLVMAGSAILVLTLVAATVAVLWPQRQSHRVTAYFERATGIYAGSQVRVLGVKIGEVSKVTPLGRSVRIDMTYDAERKIPANAQAVIVVTSLVADRYIQFTPVYRGGPALGDGAVLAIDKTAVPVELDEATSAINNLTEALGPQGANAEGSLSRLLAVGATTLDGQGDGIRRTVQGISDVTSVLAENSGNTAATIRSLDKLTKAIAASDQQIRAFTRDLTSVSEQLNAEKEELRAALRSLSIALRQVATFVRRNKKEISANVRGLADVTAVLVRQKKALETFLDRAPAAINNANLLYDAQSGTLHTRLNLLQSNDLSMWLCSLAYSLGGPPKQCETLLGPINALGLPLSRVGFDISWLTALTTDYDIVPAPPDAYGPGSRPAAGSAGEGKSGKDRADGQEGGTDAAPAAGGSDPSLGGILPPR
jgi:virulence factor Mce-like protein